MSDCPTSQSVRRTPSPLRVAVFVLLAVLTISSLIVAARAPETDASRRLDSAYYVTMGDLLTRAMLGLESQEAEGLELPEVYSADAMAETAAENYELALERREDDLALRVALATVYWHAGMRAEKQMFAHRRAGREAEAQELALRAGELKTKAIVDTLARGLDVHPGDPTITTLVLGLEPRTKVEPARVDDAALRRIAARIAPGHLLMSYLYQDVGMAQRAQAEREKAYRIGWRTVVKVSAGAIFVTVGMLAGLAIWLVVLLRWRRWRQAARDLGPTPWSVWRAVEVVVLLVFLQLAFGSAWSRLALAGEAGDLSWIAGAVLIYLAAGIVAIGWLVLAAYPTRVSLRDLGWRRIGVGTALGVGLAGYATAMPLVYPVLAVISRFIGGPGPSSPVVSVMMSASGVASRGLLIGLTVVAAPVVEETVFRGILYGALRRRMRLGWAALISGVLFAAVHGQALPFVSYALLGLVLAYLYERTGSLWAPAVAHGVFNVVSVAAVYILMA